VKSSLTPSANTTRICIPVCATRADELPRLIARASETADIIEARLDFLEETEVAKVALQLGSLLSSTRRPLLFTFRSVEEGGRSKRDAEARGDFWESFGGHLKDAARDTDVFADIELALLEKRADWQDSSIFKHANVICSHHDFASTPPDLEAVYNRMARSPARVLKIATRANDITDCVALFKLLARALAEGRELIAVAMGEAGLLTRILGPSRGAFLTFGSLDEGQATAPGQISATMLRELYRIDKITARTQITGLIGSPVAHSFSPHMHNAAFAASGVDAVYMPLEVADIDGFARRMAHPRSREFEWNLRGLSVTAPHKTSIMRWLDWTEPAALQIGAVNTVVVEGGELRGYNTDADATLAPLRELGELRGARVAVLGAGGAARALLWKLREHEAQTQLFARDLKRARSTAEEFGATLMPLDGARFDGFDVVINTTPLGTRGAKERESAATETQLRGARLAYDLVYNPAETRFMRAARAAGCEVIGGLPMLIAQAAAQFTLWTGADAPLDVMRAAAEKQRSEVGHQRPVNNSSSGH
jgi:3-dehydroquinate dehydratase/shikimate dehydrogenase